MRWLYALRCAFGRTVPATAFYFTTYDALKRQLNGIPLALQRRRTHAQNADAAAAAPAAAAATSAAAAATTTADARWSLLAGPVARAATVVASAPLELIRTNIQSHAYSYVLIARNAASATARALVVCFVYLLCCMLCL